MIVQKYPITLHELQRKLGEFYAYKDAYDSMLRGEAAPKLMLSKDFIWPMVNSAWFIGVLIGVIFAKTGNGSDGMRWIEKMSPEVMRDLWELAAEINQEIEGANLRGKTPLETEVEP